MRGLFLPQSIRHPENGNDFNRKEHKDRKNKEL